MTANCQANAFVVRNLRASWCPAQQAREPGLGNQPMIPHALLAAGRGGDDAEVRSEAGVIQGQVVLGW